MRSQEIIDDLNDSISEFEQRILLLTNQRDDLKSQLSSKWREENETQETQQQSIREALR